MSAPTLQTFEQFEQYEDDGMKHELLLGEHIVLPPANFRHSCVQHNLLHLLRPYVQQHRLGEVYVAAGFKLSSDTWLQPDVSFIRTVQIQATDPDGYFEGAPAVAVEVACDAKTAAYLDLKIGLYFAHGSEEVWVVFPKTSRVCVHYPNGHSKTFADRELRSDVFPGWSIPIDSLFHD
jgi:Uma2 family endonuclease